MSVCKTEHVWGMGWQPHSLVVCKEVIDDWRGYHIANAVCIAMAQGLKRNPHALAYLIEAGATCAQVFSNEQSASCAISISLTESTLRSRAVYPGTWGPLHAHQ